MYKFWLGCLVNRNNNNTDKWAVWQCPGWRPDLKHLFGVEHPHRIESFKLHVRGIRIDTCSRNRLKSWHKVLVWNKEENYDYKAGNIVWELTSSWRSLGKILKSSEVSWVTSKIMSVEQKQHYPLIFTISAPPPPPPGRKDPYTYLFSQWPTFLHRCFNGFSLTWVYFKTIRLMQNMV